MDAVREGHSQELHDLRLSLQKSSEDGTREMETVLAEKDKEILYLVKMKENISNAWNKEARLMSTILYEMGRELMSGDK